MWYYRISVQASAWSIKQENNLLLLITKTLGKSNLNCYPRRGKKSELKVMTSLQANYKPKHGCQASPRGNQIKIFWLERRTPSVSALLTDNVCVSRLKWTSCLRFHTTLIGSPVGSSKIGVSQLRTPSLGMLFAHCPWPRERELLKNSFWLMCSYFDLMISDYLG